jgi:hypothetical protein
VWLVWLQVSAVQTLVSLQLAFAVQQPVTGVNTQVVVAVLQLSVVHTLLSLH